MSIHHAEDRQPAGFTGAPRDEGAPRRTESGFAISTFIEQSSDEVLRVEAGSLYPALHRMTEAGLIEAEWRLSDAGRRARVYSLTPKGRRKLEADQERWRAVSAAVAKILRTT